LLKRKLITLGDDVLSGKVDKGKASVAAQCYGVAIKAVEAETKNRELEESRIVETQLRVQEQTEIISRMEQLEERLALEKKSEGRRSPWGA
jgi:peptidyl-tRNA hydrolase